MLPPGSSSQSRVRWRCTTRSSFESKLCNGQLKKSRSTLQSNRRMFDKALHVSTAPFTLPRRFLAQKRWTMMPSSKNRVCSGRQEYSMFLLMNESRSQFSNVPLRLLVGTIVGSVGGSSCIEPRCRRLGNGSAPDVLGMAH